MDDTIESINDVPLTSIEAAYRAGELASRADRIVIRGRRKGAPHVTVLIVDRGRGPSGEGPELNR